MDLEREKTRLAGCIGLLWIGGVRAAWSRRALWMTAATLLLSVAAVPEIASAAFNAYLNATPNPTTGSYTLAWDAPSGRTHLEERVNGGTWTKIGGLRPSSPMEFVDRPYGTYEYRIRWRHRRCSGRGRGGCGWLTEYSSIEVVTVAPPPPIPDSFRRQREYEYMLHSGDFDRNGYPDLLIDRLTPGPVDGSMQTVIVEGTASGPAITVPTPAELQRARSFPTEPNVKLGASDHNIDGFADIFLVGLETLQSPAYPYDCLILYASGAAGVAEPLGHQFLDEEFNEFFGSVAQAVADPRFYARNTRVRRQPIFRLRVRCPFRFGDGRFQWSLWSCYIEIRRVGFRRQVIGIGYHPSAPSASDAMERIRNDDFSDGNPWKNLSDAVKIALGVDSFGFRPNGTRRRSNYTDPNAEIDDDYNVVETRWWFSVDLRLGTPPPPVPIEDWERHEYEVDTRICSTTEDTDFFDIYPTPLGTPRVVPYSIPAAVCTLQNVFCWQKRNPAPRDDSGDDHSAEPPFDDTELWGLMSTNPIRTHVFEGALVTVNETLPADVIPGTTAHILHDPLQTLNCAAHESWPDINTNSPRCAYVHRETCMSGSDIAIRTHGEGNNGGIMDEVNEVVGEYMFEGVDEWIRRKLATKGVCAEQP